MGKQVQVKIGSVTQEGKEQFTATVLVPGLRPAKLQRKDGTTVFGTRAAAVNASRAFATAIGHELILPEKKEVVRKAAKKSSSRKSTSTPSTPTSSVS